MPVEVERILSTGRKMKAVLSVSEVGVNLALGFHGTTTDTDRAEAWEIVDTIMEQLGFDISNKPIKLKGPRSNPGVN